MSCVLRSGVADELVQQQPGDHVQRLEDSFALVGAGGKGWNLNFPIVEQKFHIFYGSDVGEVALVVLEDVRDLGEIQFESFEVLFEIGEAFDIFAHLVVLRIGDKNNAINATENELASGVIDDLAGNRIELKLGFEAFD